MEELNLNNEAIEEVKDLEPIEEEDEEQESGSAKNLVLGLVGITAAAIAVAVYVKKHKEKWAIKTLEKAGYKIEEPELEDKGEEDQDYDDDSNE